MKTKLALAAALVLAATAHAQIYGPPPPKATQTEVDAGTNNTKYVTPLTLQNKPGGGASADGQERFGSGAPAGALGVNGDSYTDTDTGERYKKNAGSWTLQFTPTAGSGAPAGSSGDIQYNNAGAFGGNTPTGTGAVVLATGPTLSGGTHTALTGLGIRSTTAAFDLKLASSEGLTAGRTLSIVLGNADRVLSINGNVSMNQSVQSSSSPTFSALTLTTPLTVNMGGSGRTTGTTAYSLIATGTTATGNQQTLANGLTTQILVGGGPSALPPWSTTLPNGITATTQTAGDTSTKVSTTAYSDAAVKARKVTFALTIDAVANGMNYTVGFVPAAFTITDLYFVHSGTTSSPSVTPSIFYGTDRSSGTAVVTAPAAVTSTTTGTHVTSFDNATPPAGSWIWITTASTSGTTDQFNVVVVGHY